MFSFTRQGKHFPTSEKNFIHRYWSKKNPSRHRQRKLTDRGLKGKSPGDADRTFPHRQNNSQHKSWNSRDCYLPADIAQAFLQTLAVIFFHGRGCCFIRCCRKNLQCRSARFSCSSSTEVVFRPTTACFHLLGKESISPPRKKTWFTDTDKQIC